MTHLSGIVLSLRVFPLEMWRGALAAGDSCQSRFEIGLLGLEIPLLLGTAALLVLQVLSEHLGVTQDAIELCLLLRLLQPTMESVSAYFAYVASHTDDSFWVLDEACNASRHDYYLAYNALC